MNFNARQISGQDERGRYSLSVIVKITYQILETGSCEPAEFSLPLTDDISFYPESMDLIDEDIDLMHMKLYTDVVVKGRACTYRPLPEFPVRVQIGGHKATIMAIGPRKAYRDAYGRIVFTEPEMIQEVPLRYDFAYGGKDAVAEEKFSLPTEEFAKYLPPGADLMAGSPYRYPRNPVGKGYLVELNQRSLEQLELPNLEDPEDRLSPSRILVGQPDRWLEMPLPRCTDWVSPTWFPRMAYIGLPRPAEKPSLQIAEITRKWAEPDVFNIKPMSGMFHFRAANGASLGLQLPYLQTGLTCRLGNIHPKYPDFSLVLPSDYPSIWVDGRQGKLKETTPVIQSLIIELDKGRLSIVWRGSAPALRPYLEEELKTMPFKVQWN